MHALRELLLLELASHFVREEAEALAGARQRLQVIALLGCRLSHGLKGGVSSPARARSSMPVTASHCSKGVERRGEEARHCRLERKPKIEYKTQWGRGSVAKARTE